MFSIVLSIILTVASPVRADLEWSGGAARAPLCTVGYLAEGPSLEQACCEAAESHSQQLAQDLNASATAQQTASSTKKESKGAAGASSAGSSSILVGLSCPFMINVYQFLKFRISIRILVRRSPGLSKVGNICRWSHDSAL